MHAAIRALGIERWQWIAVGAALWLMELVLQAVYVVPVCGTPQPVAVLAVPAALAVAFTIWSDLSWSTLRRQLRERARPVLTLTPRIDSVLIRAQLAALGQRRLSGEITEEQFITERTAILIPLTHPPTTRHSNLS